MFVFAACERIQSTSKRQRKAGGKMFFCMRLFSNTSLTLSKALINVTLNTRVDFHWCAHSCHMIKLQGSFQMSQGSVMLITLEPTEKF